MKDTMNWGGIVPQRSYEPCATVRTVLMAVDEVDREILLLLETINKKMQLLLILLLIPTVQVTAFLLTAGNVQWTRTSCASTHDVKLHASPTTTTDETSSSASHQERDNIRPLTQNWWPVSLLSALDQTKPNAIELLDKKLVLWYDITGEGSDGLWSCLDDQCAHRFAPLSEGRIVTNATSSGKSCLQCAYHGWEFERRGGCNRIPQAANDNAKSSKLCSVQSYPIKISAGMIWVWADPIVKPSEEDPPISNLLQRFDEAG